MCYAGRGSPQWKFLSSTGRVNESERCMNEDWWRHRSYELLAPISEGGTSKVTYGKHEGASSHCR